LQDAEGVASGHVPVPDGPSVIPETLKRLRVSVAYLSAAFAVFVAFLVIFEVARYENVSGPDVVLKSSRLETVSSPKK
jgi:hypothetical protein